MGYRFDTFAKQYLDITNVTGAEAMCRCPIHKGSNYNMQFNLETGLWVCFRCGEGGSIKRLMAEFGIRTVEENAPDILSIRKKLRNLSKESGKALPYGEIQDESILSRYNIPTNYWKDRGFSQTTIDAFELGYDPMNDAVTIPMRTLNGELLGVTYRYLGDDIDLRYKYPYKFVRSKNLFGSWMADQHDSDTAVIVEGAVDAIKVWQAGYIGLAQYGSSISTAQIRLLRRLGVGQVVLFYDNDVAGRKAELRARGIKRHVRRGKTYDEYDPTLDLRKSFFVRCVKYGKGDPDDPGAMNTKTIRRLVDSAKRVA